MPTLPDLNIATRMNHSPHVVILGAGGSKTALAFATLQMTPWKTNRLPSSKSLAKLDKWIEPLIAEENAGQFTGSPCPTV